MLQAKEITGLLAKTYFSAAKSEGADMLKIAAVLENLRPRFTDQPAYNIWKHIRLDEADLNNPALLRVFVGLKYDYYELILRSAIRLITTEAEKNPENAFQTWLRIYVDALINWESNVYDRIDDIRPKLSKDQLAFMHGAQKYHNYVRENRWAECYDWYAGLAGHAELPDVQRAALEIIAGQIQLYHILDQDAAREHFEKAALIASPSARTERAFGDLHLKKQEFDAARLRYMAAMSHDAEDPDNYIALGDSYRDERKFKLAEDYYRQAIQRNPLDASGYDRLVYLYGEPELFSANVETIPDLLKKVELLNPKAKDERFGNWRYGVYRSTGGAYYRNNDFKQAASWYKKAIKSQPKWPLAYLDLGYALYADKKSAQAEKNFLQAETLSPDHFDVCWALAWYYDQEKKGERAAGYYLRCLQIRPQSGKTLHSSLGDLYFNQIKDYAAAVEQYEKATTFNPGDAAVFEKLAKAYNQLDLTERAESAWRRAATLDPSKSDFQNEIGIIHYKRGEYAKAAEYFQKALDLRPTDVVLCDNLGQAYQHADMPEEAERAFLKSLEIAPEADGYHNRLANFYMNQQQPEKAEGYYRKAIELNPANAVYFENMAFALKKQDKLKEAIPYFEKAAALAPANSNYPNEIGIIYFTLQDYVKASGYFVTATKLNPADGILFDNLAQTLENEGKDRDAEKAYLKAAALLPGRGDIQNRVGNYYANRGKREKAIAFYQKAIEADPGNAVYQINLAEVYYQKGDHKASAEMIIRALELQPDNESYLGYLAAILHTLDDKTAFVARLHAITQLHPELGAKYVAAIETLDIQKKMSNKVDEG